MLISDIVMPEFDGMKVLREVVEVRGCREPVAVISSVARKPRPSVIAAALGAERVRPASSYTVNAVTDYGSTQVAGDPRVLLRRHPLNLADFGDNALGDMRWGGSTDLISIKSLVTEAGYTPTAA